MRRVEGGQILVRHRARKGQQWGVSHSFNWDISASSGGTGVIRCSMDSSTQKPELGRGAVDASLQIGAHILILARYGLRSPRRIGARVVSARFLTSLTGQDPSLTAQLNTPHGTIMHLPCMAGAGWASSVLWFHGGLRHQCVDIHVDVHFLFQVLRDGGGAPAVHGQDCGDYLWSWRECRGDVLPITMTGLGRCRVSLAPESAA